MSPAVGLSGAVTASGHGAGTLVGAVENPAETPATLTGTVGTGEIASWLGPLLQWRYRIKLGARFLPASSLSGLYEESESIDSPSVGFSFGLVGREWLPTNTERTWTRTAVEVWVDHGPPGAVRSILWRAGVVVGCEIEAGGDVVNVRCRDLGGLYSEADLCFELAPLAGLRRGAIARSMLASVGVASTRIPDGATYNGPVQAIGSKLWDTLQELGEPEGWSWRVLADGTVEAYSAAVVASPGLPHHTWDLGSIESIEIEAPSPTASRWVVRGHGAVEVDELGITTTTTETEIYALYAPAHPDRRQETDGSITSLGGAEGESLRLVRRIVDRLQKRGDKPVAQTTDEWGWYNPAAGRLRTPNSAEADGPVGGYYYVQAYIEAGSDRYVAWRRQKFVQVGRRQISWTYDADGNLTRQTTTTTSWRSRRSAVRTTAPAWVNGVRVGHDDESYFVVEGNRLEEFDLASQDVATYTYGESGAVIEEDTRHSGYYAPGARIDGGGYYILFSGTGQVEIVANWRERSREVQVNLVSEDGLLLGTNTTNYGWSAPRKADGAYDWGEHLSNYEEEIYALTGIERVAHTILSEDSWEEVRYSAQGNATRTLHYGAPPVARFQASAWTQLVQQPVECRFEDGVLETWFGFRREVIQHPYVQSVAEACALAERRIARSLSHKVQVKRPWDHARAGETVLLDLPGWGLVGRGLITEISRSFSPETGEATAIVTMEVPL